MAATIRAVYDGAVLRPEQPVDLRPDTTYVITIEGEAPTEGAANPDVYPLTEIASLAADMGLSDLSARHGWYAHRQIPDTGPDGS